MLSEDESLRVYVARLRESITNLDREQTHLITPDEPIVAGLLPGLTWTDRRTDEESIDLLDVPDRLRRCVLLGEPGSGKSMCLRRLALACLDRTDPLPLYASLAEWTDPRVGAAEFLRARFRRMAGPDSPLAGRFDELLADGRLLMILDGLNELPERLTGPLPDDGYPPRLDRRERSLRVLAGTDGLRCAFVLACRDHDYAGAPDWHAVRVRPMSAEQVDRYLGDRLEPAAAGELRRAIDGSPVLPEVCRTPFFLSAIATAHRPGTPVGGRGAILDRLLERRLAAITGIPDKAEIVRTIGRLAYRMLVANRVGGDVPIRPAGDRARACAEALAQAGFLIERNGEIFFYHQIVQEFLAASALRDGVIRARRMRPRPDTLLAYRNWVETVALWYDLDPERVLPHLMRGLRGGALPGGLPRPPGSRVLGRVLWLPVMAGVLLTLSAYALDWILWPVHVPPSPFGLVPLPPLALAGVVWVIFLVWSRLTARWVVIANSARVLALARVPGAVPATIEAFGRAPSTSHAAQIARSIAGFGPFAVPYVIGGLGNADWRIRAGCVSALGELSRNLPGDARVNAALLAVARSGDPGLVRPLAQAIGRSRDPGLIDVVVELLAQAPGRFPLSPLSGLAKWRPDTSGWGEDVIARFDPFLERERPPSLRMAAMELMAALRLPGCERRLAAIAAEPCDEEPYLPQAAIMDLGTAQTPAAIAELSELADRYDQRVNRAVAGAIERVRDPAVIPALGPLATHDFAPIRAAVAVACGAAGGPAAGTMLGRLAEDADPAVRAAAARGLGTIGRRDAVAPLAGLARDHEPGVRRAAVDVLQVAYPDLAITDLLALAADPAYEDRVYVIGLLARIAHPSVVAGLNGLAADADPQVRTAAPAAVRGLSGTGPRSGLRGRVADALRLDLLRALRREERLVRRTEPGLTSGLFRILPPPGEGTEKIMAGPFRGVVTTVAVIFYGALAGAIFALSLMLRLCLWATGALLSAWPVAVPVTLAILATGYVSSLDGVSRGLGETVKWLSVVAYLVLAVLIAGALTYVWWIVLLLAAAAVAVVAARRALIRRRRPAITVSF